MRLSKFRTYFEYFEIFILVLMTVGPYSQGAKIATYFIFMMINYKYLISYSHFPRFFLVLLFLMILPIILDIRNMDSENPFSPASFAFVIPFVISYLFVKKYSYQKFLKILENVIFFTAICSLAGMLLIYMAPQIILAFPVRQYYQRTIYSVVLFNAQLIDSISISKRNFGVAFEPGAYQFILNLGVTILFTNIKQYKNAHVIGRLLVYIISILWTRSTMGIIIFAMIFLINSLRTKRTLIIMSLIVVLTSFFWGQTVLFQVNKMASGSAGNINSRFGNSVYVINNYAKYLLGIGSTGYNKIYKANTAIGSWDIYTNLYMRFGLPFMILFLYMNLKLLKINKSLFVVIAMTLLTESVVGPITVMFYFYANSVEVKSRKLLKRG